MIYSNNWWAWKNSTLHSRSRMKSLRKKISSQHLECMRRLDLNLFKICNNSWIKLNTITNGVTFRQRNWSSLNQLPDKMPRILSTKCALCKWSSKIKTRNMNQLKKNTRHSSMLLRCLFLLRKANLIKSIKRKRF